MYPDMILLKSLKSVKKIGARHSQTNRIPTLLSSTWTTALILCVRRTPPTAMASASRWSMRRPTWRVLCSQMHESPQSSESSLFCRHSLTFCKAIKTILGTKVSVILTRLRSCCAVSKALVSSMAKPALKCPTSSLILYLSQQSNQPLQRAHNLTWFLLRHRQCLKLIVGWLKRQQRCSMTLLKQRENHKLHKNSLV